MKGRIVNYVGISPPAESIFLAGRIAALDMLDAFFFFEDVM
jgi:hypothetical protein